MENFGSNKTSRRKFLQWAAVVAYPSVPSMLLNACGAGGDGVGSIIGDLTLVGGGTTPVTQATEVFPKTLSLTAMPVKAVYVPGSIPTTPNAWTYVNTAKVNAPLPLLSSHFGPTIQVTRKVPLSVTWNNGIGPTAVGSSYQAKPPTNPSATYNDLCGSVAAQSPVGIVVHLHGARVNGGFDGWPLSPLGFAGNPYGFPTSSQYIYPNDQRAALIWYHDHSLDNTAMNVFAGLAGMYVIRDDFDDKLMALLKGSAQEKLMAVHDRILTQGNLGVDYMGGRVMNTGTAAAPVYTATNAAGVTTTYNAVRAEYMGAGLFINGNPASSANANYDRRMYRLRLLNASNARTYTFALFDPAALSAGTGRIWYSDAITIIGTDQGFASKSIQLASNGYFNLCSGERIDLLVDFSKIPSTVKSLKLANLAIGYRAPFTPATVPPTPEAIFTSYINSIIAPTSVNYLATSPIPNTAAGITQADLYNALLTDPVATLNSFNLNSNTAAQITSFNVPTIAQINSILNAAAPDIDFGWNGTQLTPLPGRNFGPNRFIQMITNIEGFSGTTTVNGVSRSNYGNGLDGWSDVQIFELVDGSIVPDPDNANWNLPVNIDLKTTLNPAPGDVTSAITVAAQQQVKYTIARRSFLQTRSNPDITIAKKYPALHTPTIISKAGTYERWYVSNIPNSQPLTNARGAADMHPFHVHLVTMVVLRRWELQSDGFFKLLTPEPLDYIARQDTVLLPSNQLIEILACFPPGYTGDYAYHCHLVEHEDACMMSSFRVIP